MGQCPTFRRLGAGPLSRRARPAHHGAISTPASQLRPFRELPHNIAPLGYRNFVLYWLGHAVSTSGRWIELTGVVWLMYELTASPVLLGLLGLARAAPALLLGPIAGVVSDRVDQRRLLLATQLLAFVGSLLLSILVLTGRIEFWHLYVQVAMQTVAHVFSAAVRQALFPRTVPRLYLSEAVTLHATAGRTAALIGPAIGGLALARFGEVAPFALNAATAPALMAAVVWMRGIAPPPAVVSSFRGELMEGLRYIVNVPVLNALLRMEIAYGIFAANAVMITVVGREVLGVGPDGLGGLLSAPAAGAVVGIACLLTIGQPRRQGRFVVVCAIAYASTLLAFSLSRDYAVSFAALVAGGFLDALATVTRSSVWHLAAPGHLRGRVMGNMATVTRSLEQFAATQSGLLAGALGGPLAVFSAAAMLAAAAGATARANPALWSFSREADPPAAGGADRPPPP